MFTFLSISSKLNLINQTNRSHSTLQLLPPLVKAKTAMADYATVTYVTAPNEEVARNLARNLVEKRLAACVNIVKTVESIYEWKGQIEQDNESMLIIKSHSSKTNDLTEFVDKNHPYECPEIITLRVDSGSKKYLDWIQESLAKKPTPSVVSQPKE